MGYRIDVCEGKCFRYDGIQVVIGVVIETKTSTDESSFYMIGAEAKALGIHNQLGPVAGPLGKIPVVRSSLSPILQ